MILEMDLGRPIGVVEEDHMTWLSNRSVQSFNQAMEARQLTVVRCGAATVVK